MRITVITVCFNEEKNIARTLESVLNQTTSDFEYIICDGKSSDRTMEIVESYREKFAEKGIDFKVYSEKDGGVYFGMNNAIDRATGDYIIFINGGDDFASDEVICEVSKFIENADIKPDVVYGDYNYIDNGTSCVMVGNHELLTEGMSIGHPCSFCSLDSMKKYKFNTDYKICADYNFMLDVYSNGGVFMHIPMVTSNFYTGGISTKNPKLSLREDQKTHAAHNIVHPRKYYTVKYLNILKNTTISNLKRSIVNIYSSVLKKMGRVIPINKKLWLFGAWSGNLYSDNTKCVFEYVNSIKKDTKCVWISRNDSVVEQVRKAGFRSYKELSIKGLWYSARAQAAFCTEHAEVVSRFLNRKTKIINLWHGMGIKAVGIESGWVKGKTEDEMREYHKYCYDNYSKWHWMCASEEAKQKYARSFLVPEEMFYITGQPKDDSFANLKESSYINEIRTEHPGAKIAVYLPTHRNFGRGVHIADETSIETLKKVNEKLAEKNIVMIFKPHYHEFKKYEGYTENFSNIIFATDKEKFGDVYTFLPVCDMLITDYSGIMFGYLASGKPIIYFTYDYDEYVAGDAGFCYDFNDITYGPVCKTWDEVIENMDKITADDYKEIREKQRARFCPYSDGKNCERVYEQVKKL